MKRLFGLLTIVIIPGILFSQTNSLQVIASSGNYFENSNVSISCTLGEIAIETLSNDNLKLTQGFQQSEITVMSVQDVAAGEINITVYPNPTSDLLFVEINDNPNSKIVIELIDATGRLLINQNIEKYPVFTELDLKPYLSGIYLLKIRSKEYSVNKAFQISDYEFL